MMRAMPIGKGKPVDMRTGEPIPEMVLGKPKRGRGRPPGSKNKAPGRRQPNINWEELKKRAREAGGVVHALGEESRGMSGSGLKSIFRRISPKTRETLKKAGIATATALAAALAAHHNNSGGPSVQPGRGKVAQGELSRRQRVKRDALDAPFFDVLTDNEVQAGRGLSLAGIKKLWRKIPLPRKQTLKKLGIASAAAFAAAAAAHDLNFKGPETETFPSRTKPTGIFKNLPEFKELREATARGPTFGIPDRFKSKPAPTFKNERSFDDIRSTVLPDASKFPKHKFPKQPKGMQFHDGDFFYDADEGSGLPGAKPKVTKSSTLRVPQMSNEDQMLRQAQDITSMQVSKEQRGIAQARQAVSEAFGGTDGKQDLLSASNLSQAFKDQVDGLQPEQILGALAAAATGEGSGQRKVLLKVLKESGDDLQAMLQSFLKANKQSVKDYGKDWKNVVNEWISQNKPSQETAEKTGAAGNEITAAFAKSRAGASFINSVKDRLGQTTMNALYYYIITGLGAAYTMGAGASISTMAGAAVQAAKAALLADASTATAFLTNPSLHSAMAAGSLAGRLFGSGIGKMEGGDISRRLAMAAGGAALGGLAKRGADALFADPVIEQRRKPGSVTVNARTRKMLERIGSGLDSIIDFTDQNVGITPFAVGGGLLLLPSGAKWASGYAKNLQGKIRDQFTQTLPTLSKDELIKLPARFEDLDVADLGPGKGEEYVGGKNLPSLVGAGLSQAGAGLASGILAHMREEELKKAQKKQVKKIEPELKEIKKSLPESLFTTVAVGGGLLVLPRLLDYLDLLPGPVGFPRAAGGRAGSGRAMPARRGGGGEADPLPGGGGGESSSRYDLTNRQFMELVGDKNYDDGLGQAGSGLGSTALSVVKRLMASYGKSFMCKMAAVLLEQHCIDDIPAVTIAKAAGRRAMDLHESGKPAQARKIVNLVAKAGAHNEANPKKKRKLK